MLVISTYLNDNAQTQLHRFVVYLRYNKIKFVCLSVSSNRPQFPLDQHQTWQVSWDSSLRDRVLYLRENELNKTINSILAAKLLLGHVVRPTTDLIHMSQTPTAGMSLIWVEPTEFSTGRQISAVACEVSLSH